MALEKFCLCCKLRNGAFICGVCCILLNSILLITIVSSNIFMYKSPVEIRDILLYESHMQQVLDETFPSSHETHTTWHPTPLFWFFLVVSTIDLIASILLVIGAVKFQFLN